MSGMCPIKIPRAVKPCIGFATTAPAENGMSRECMTDEYVELHARSAFSFLEGACVPEELVSACSRMDSSAMALLDRDGVYSAARFHMAAKKCGLRAHIGAELTVDFGTAGNPHPGSNSLFCKKPKG